ncbi:DoxX family protein [Streptomyces sp. A7024]|uniref:DoxX family protein n=1 Tax=Streptomyces coryli TaxID=1128680 RepID=A0A6G4TXI7_9ACTN|nr:DoxX family protein [Streptomyces coryli]NGN64695.1 DoxX family protein [Streptomyces coryli]
MSMDTSGIRSPAGEAGPAAARAGVRAEDVGLLLVRVVFGLLLAGHGTQKLFGWFGGGGLEAEAGEMAGDGYEPGKLFAVVAGCSETGGGLLFAAGLLTPLGCAAIVGTMINAIATELEAGVYEGYELALTYLTAATAVAFTGPGRLALDAGRPWQRSGFGWAAAALGLAAGTAAVTLVLRAV